MRRGDGTHGQQVCDTVLLPEAEETMTNVGPSERDAFFKDVDEACRKAVWAAVATVRGDGPRVRLVHPTWEGDTLWFATDPTSPKGVQIQANANVDIQYQVAPPDFVHILVRGRAEILTDDATRKRVWDVMDYDLSQFWPDGPTAPGYASVHITPSRVELSKMFGTTDKRVWRA
jgi:general stress protein 26